MDAQTWQRRTSTLFHSQVEKHALIKAPTANQEATLPGRVMGMSFSVSMSLASSGRRDKCHPGTKSYQGEAEAIKKGHQKSQHKRGFVRVKRGKKRRQRRQRIQRRQRRQRRQRKTK
jgi:hypothetical protein